MNYAGRLMRFAEMGNVAEIKRLVGRRRVTVNSCYEDGTTALMHAAEYGQVDAVRALLHMGADADAVARVYKFKTGRTALLLAVSRDVVLALLPRSSGTTIERALNGYVRKEFRPVIADHLRKRRRELEDALLDVGDAFPVEIADLCGQYVIDPRRR